MKEEKKDDMSVAEEQIKSLESSRFSSVETRSTDFGMAMAVIHKPKSNLFSIKNETERPLNQSFHSHINFEMVYVLEGVFTHHLEKAVYTLNAGEFTFLNNNIQHFEGRETDCYCVYLSMSKEFLDKLFSNSGLILLSNHHNSRIFQPFCTTETEGKDVKRAALNFQRTVSSKEMFNETTRSQQILDELGKVIIEREWGYGFAVQSLLLKLFYELENPAQYHVVQIRTDSHPEEILFSSIQNLVKERNGRITRGELSELLHYHPDYLGRIVKKQSGKSYMQYCQQVWVDKAKELFSLSNMHVDEIVRTLGFVNKGYFYRIFVESTSMTPNEYRARYSQIFHSKA